MAQVLNCPRGHRWDAPGDTPAEAPAVSTACPVCGETQIDTDSEQLHGLDTHVDELPPVPQDLPGSSTPKRYSESVDAMPLRVPGYEILRELGRGGMGVVYQARQPALDRIVALKMIRSGADAQPEELARFRVEAEAVARLQHPNIVQIYEVGAADGLPYFSLEFVDGQSLADQLDGTPWPPQQTAQLAETLARAIHYAHQRDIIHRDLKPANVLMPVASGLLPLAENARAVASLATNNLQLATAKITDFGLAKKLDELASAMTSTGAILGTPSYMAPEQATGKTGAIGPAADVYALGIILYELLTGRPPFRSAQALDTLQQVLFDDPVPPRQLQPKTPRDLETICLKCLQKEPAKRYGSAKDLAEDLRRFQAGEPILARPVGSLERAQKWVRRHPAAAGMVAVSILAVVALLVTSLIYTRWLEQSREDAVWAEGQAERGRIAALNAEAEARRRETQTKHSLKKSLAAVDQFLTRVAEMRILHTPHMEPERVKIFEDALTFCREFIDENLKEPLAAEEVGLTLIRRARLNLRLNRLPEADESFRDAIRFLEQMASKEPPSTFSLYQRAAALHEMGDHLYARQAKHDSAQKALVQARDILKPLIEREPTLANRVLLGRVLHGLGEQELIQLRRKEARDLFLTTLNHWSELLKDEPKAPEVRVRCAQTWHKLALTSFATKVAPEAEKAYKNYLSLMEELYAEFPEEIEYLSDLGMACLNLGNFYEMTGQDSRAGELFQRALDHLKVLVERRPGNPEFQSKLAAANHDAGALFYKQKDLDQAEKFLQKARELSEDVVRGYSHFKPFVLPLALHYYAIGELHRTKHQPEQSVAAHRESLRLLEELVASDSRTLQYTFERGKVAMHLGYLTWPKAQNLQTMLLFDKAVTSFEAVLAQDPEHVDAERFLRQTLKLRDFARSKLKSKES